MHKILILRYFLKLAYKGSNYFGWQVQPNVSTIQEEVEQAIATVLQKKITLVGAGRTDAGVHALQMYAHFDTDINITKNTVYKLNRVLPNDIVIYKVFRVPDTAHARFSAISRSYKYNIWLGKNPFLQETSWQFYNRVPDVELMNKATKILFKYNNFQCFSKVKTDVHTFNCNITEAMWLLNEKELTFYISANRFLRNMVRAIVGTLLDVGYKKTTLDELKKIIENKNRSDAGMSVPAKGLFLTKVEYDFF